MKRITILHIIVITTMAFISAACGKSSITPQTTKIAGPLGEFFEVVDRAYNIRTNRGDKIIFIELQRVKEGGPQDANWGTSPTFILSLLDSNGDVISSDETDVVTDSKELEAIFQLRKGESFVLPFTFNKNLEEASILKISSRWTNGEEAPKSDDAEADTQR